MLGAAAQQRVAQGAQALRQERAVEGPVPLQVLHCQLRQLRKRDPRPYGPYRAYTLWGLDPIGT